MKRLSVILLVALVFSFAGCGGDDGGGPAPVNITAPSGLTANVVGTLVGLNWTDNSYNEAGFRVERAASGTGNWSVIAELETDAEVYVDTVTTEGTRLDYRVKAFLLESESGPTNVVGVVIPPKAPANLTAEQDADITNQINLTWDDSSAVETGYELQRRRSRATFISIDTLEADVTGFVDTGLEDNTTYYYRVRALLDTVSSAWSDEAEAVTTVYTPMAPTELTATSLSSSTARLLWRDNSYNEDGFIVQSSLSVGGGWEHVDSLRADIMTYTAEDLTSETTYYFRVFAYNEFGNSDYSNTASITTPAGPPLPPSDLTAEAPAFNQVLLRWQDNSDDELGFRLQRHGSRSSIWDDLATMATDVTSYIDEDVTANNTYYYRVGAFKVVDGDTLRSLWSSTTEATTPEGPPQPPTDLVVQRAGLHELTVTWRPSANATNILVERAVDQAPYEQLAALNGNVNTYIDRNLNINTLYFYRAKSINGVGESEYSNEDGATTLSLTDPPRVDEDFEALPTQEPPTGGPWTNYESIGTSWAFVTEDQPYSGSKSLQFHDPDMDDSSFVRVTLSTEGAAHSVFQTWLYIPANSFFGLIGGDAADYITWQIQFNNDGRYFYRSGGNTLQGNDYPVGQWFNLLVTWDVTSREWTISFNNQQEINQTIYLQRNDHQSNAVILFICFGNQILTDGFMDDVMVADVDEAALAPSAPRGPVRTLEAVPVGNLKISDVGLMHLP